jgi:hypothetical protein
MRKIMAIIGMILLLNIGLIHAQEHNFAETKQLIDSGISCDKLTDEQLEAIGEYYMEQMHPGESHEMMDKMMGGEGSASLRQMHISMAQRLYCNEDSSGMMGGGMMGMMMGGGMMGNNMMGNGMFGSQTAQANMMQGMMGGWSYGYFSFMNILNIILLIGLIILVYLWIVKLWQNIKHKRW